MLRRSDNCLSFGACFLALAQSLGIDYLKADSGAVLKSNFDYR